MRRWLVLRGKEYGLEIAHVMPHDAIVELPEFVSQEMLPYISVGEEGGKLVPKIDQDKYQSRIADDRSLLIQFDEERRKSLVEAVKLIEGRKAFNERSPLSRAYYNLFGPLGEKALLFILSSIGERFKKESK